MRIRARRKPSKDETSLRNQDVDYTIRSIDRNLMIMQVFSVGSRLTMHEGSIHIPVTKGLTSNDPSPLNKSYKRGN